MQAKNTCRCANQCPHTQSAQTCVHHKAVCFTHASPPSHALRHLCTSLLLYYLLYHSVLQLSHIAPPLLIMSISDCFNVRRVLPSNLATQAPNTGRGCCAASFFAGFAGAAGGGGAALAAAAAASASACASAVA